MLYATSNKAVILIGKTCLYKQDVDGSD